MPPQPRRAKPKDASPSAGSGRTERKCKALTTSGRPCQLAAVQGLTVCRKHGGGTAASVRAGKRRVVADQISGLWGVVTDAGSISVEEELQKLAVGKIRDITALRIKISGDSVTRHIGRLVETETVTEYDIEGTVQSKSGSQVSQTKRADTSVWVKELHKCETELLAILRLLSEVTGDGGEVDIKRIRMQTAREAARLLKAFPGISVDEVAAEVSKKAS